MAFQVSPGVDVREIDLTNVVAGAATSIGAFVGEFVWGPANVARTVSSEKDLAEVFGAPTSESTAQYFYTAASYLNYSTDLRVVRVVNDTDALNATSDGNGVLIENEDVYDAAAWSADGTLAAKYPGALGNNIRVEICPADSATFAGWSNAGLFTGSPETSDYVESRGGSNDEVHVAVIDAGGAISGTPGTVLEIFEFLSQAPGAKGTNGVSIYYADVLNRDSQYVWWTAHPTLLTHAGTPVDTLVAGAEAGDYLDSVVAALITENLTGGDNGTAVAPADVSTAFALFADEDTNVDFLFYVPASDDADAQAQAAAAIAVAEGRKDAIAFISAPLSTTVNNAGNEAADLVTFFDAIASSSYAVFDSTAVKVYDKYNDTFRWIPASGHLAGLCAFTDLNADAWFSPAGLNRGQLLGITKIAFNPNKSARDTLYKARINPIVTFPGEGTVLFGDKTALKKPSAFDRINVRRLFIVLEKAISTSAKFQLFEFNDEFTRAQFRNSVDPFLREVQGRRGITDYLVVCDETNNTGQVVDNNRFVADIYIKPARSINFITLNFVATRTDVSFSEVVG